MLKRKFLILSSLCLLFAGSGMAQANKFKREFSVGPSFGMTFSSISFYPKVNQGMLQGYTGGVAVRWITEKNLGLQAELNYTQQGWKEAFEEQPQYTYNRTINYIELPFLTHFYFGSNRFHVYLNLGPKIGYALNEKTESNLNGEEPNRTNDQHDMAIEKRFDYSSSKGGITMPWVISSIARRAILLPNPPHRYSGPNLFICSPYFRGIGGLD